MKKIITLAFSLAFLFSVVLTKEGALQAQNVAITDDNGYTADPSAMLDVKSTTKGVLAPRVSTTQRNAISSPANGLLVFDTSLGSFYFYNGSSWTNLTSGNASGVWSSGTGTVYLSTGTDKVGIGISSPLHMLHIMEANSTTDGTDGCFIDIQNNVTTNGVLSGIRFKTNNSVDRFKGGIIYQRTSTYGRGDLIFANNSTSNATNFTTSDARMKIKNSGNVEVIGSSTSADNEAIFQVVNDNGDTIFAVYPQGVRINVLDDPATKAAGSRSGFAVGGFSLTKTLTNEYLRVTPDSVRIYIDDNGGAKASASKGGFAVGGFSLTKNLPQDYMNISGASDPEIINPAEARIVWYPAKEALLSGMVLIESIDSIGQNSMATGNESKAIGNYSQAFGFHARAFGNNSTAIGNYANAMSNNSFAFGDSAIAKGVGSYAFGSVGRNTTTGAATLIPTMAKGDFSVAFGLGAQADTIGAFAIGNESHAEGAFTTALGYKSNSVGKFSTAIGYESTATGQYSAAIGYRASSGGTSSSALGSYSTASGPNSFAAGDNCWATGTATSSIGADNIASGSYSTAMGVLSEASGYAAFAAGETCVASGQAAVSIGQLNLANSYTSFAAGSQNQSIAEGAITLGSSNTASGIFSSAFGVLNTASGSYSRAIGSNTSATQLFSQAYGKGISSQADYSVAWALNDQNGTIITAPNSFVLMGGQVGINTINPEAPLDVETNASGYAIHLEETSTGLEDWQIGVDAAGDLNFYDGTTNSVTFEDGGDVGVGVVAPNCKLHVRGDAGLNAFRVQVGTATKIVVLSNGGTSLGSNNTNAPADGLYVSGSTGIGRNVTTNKLEVNGNASKTASGSWLANSDKRIKNNIKDIENACETILRLRPVKFKYTKEWKKRNPSITNDDYYNFIAQEFQEVFPQSVQGSGEFIKGDKDEILQIDTYNAQIVNIKATQDLIIENKEQQKRIAELENQLDIITNQNSYMNAEITSIKSMLQQSAAK